LEDRADPGGLVDLAELEDRADRVGRAELEDRVGLVLADLPDLLNRRTAVNGNTGQSIEEALHTRIEKRPIGLRVRLNSSVRGKLLTGLQPSYLAEREIDQVEELARIVRVAELRLLVRRAAAVVRGRPRVLAALGVGIA
jgi:hypothetical protein